METYDNVSRKVPSSHYHNNSERTTLKETKQNNSIDNVSTGRNFATKILTYSIRITLLFSSSYTILLRALYEQDNYALFT